VQGVLILEDGRRFVGSAFGARATRVGEAVFNTSMTGYQEVLTDPSYAEQIVTMTVAHVGNTGVNAADPESAAVHASAFVARRFTDEPSSWRSEEGLGPYLARYGVPGLHGIDTRSLVRHLRTRGAMKAVVSTDGTSDEALLAQLAAYPGMAGRALATTVGRKDSVVFAEGEPGAMTVSVVDGGLKSNILRLLAREGVRVVVHPITASAETWMSGADAVLFGNGPGDPAALGDVIDQVRATVGKVPTLGICLGCQLLSLALGATTYKLTFGHRGGNHPVRDITTGRVAITSQNHGFAVDADSLVAAGARVTHVNLNDQTVSGFAHDARRVFAVQYHPEASPGPHDSAPVFGAFLDFARGAS